MCEHHGSVHLFRACAHKLTSRFACCRGSQCRRRPRLLARSNMGADDPAYVLGSGAVQQRGGERGSGGAGRTEPGATAAQLAPRAALHRQRLRGWDGLVRTQSFGLALAGQSSSRMPASSCVSTQVIGNGIASQTVLCCAGTSSKTTERTTAKAIRGPAPRVRSIAGVG